MHPALQPTRTGMVVDGIKGESCDSQERGLETHKTGGERAEARLKKKGDSGFKASLIGLEAAISC